VHAKLEKWIFEEPELRDITLQCPVWRGTSHTHWDIYKITKRKHVQGLPYITLR